MPRTRAKAHRIYSSSCGRKKKIFAKNFVHSAGKTAKRLNFVAGVDDFLRLRLWHKIN